MNMLQEGKVGEEAAGYREDRGQQGLTYADEVVHRELQWLDVHVWQQAPFSVLPQQTCHN